MGEKYSVYGSIIKTYVKKRCLGINHPSWKTL